MPRSAVDDLVVSKGILVVVAAVVVVPDLQGFNTNKSELRAVRPSFCKSLC